jgi:ATP-dependent Lon protease
VILPKSNEKDLRDVPDEVRNNMAFTFVQTMDEVLLLALLKRDGGMADQPALEEGDELPRRTSSDRELPPEAA